MAIIDQIKQLREVTGVSVAECRKAILEAKGDLAMAQEILKKWGKNFAQRKADRKAEEGIVESYIHSGKKIGAMIELHCETDFVAKGDDFQKLARELCLQIVAMNPDDNSLISQFWIKDESRTVKDLVDEYITKVGENIEIKRFIRFEL